MSFNNLAGQNQRITTILPTTNATNTFYTLSSKQSGSIIFLNETNFQTLSTLRLPPPDFGLNFKFINQTNGTSKTIYIKSYNNSQVLTPLIYRSKSLTNNNNTTLKDTITITFSNTEVGDEVNLYCDGTYWYANGIVANINAYN